MNLKSAPLWYQRLPIGDIHKKASEYKLDPFLVSAIIRQESGGNTWAMRFEPKSSSLVFPEDFAKKNGITVQTETVLQGSSLGLMQVMGYVARGQGFKESLTSLFDPEIGTGEGCKLLNALSKRFTELEDCISAYNQGSPRRAANGTYTNQLYVSSVIAYMKELTQSF